VGQLLVLLGQGLLVGLAVAAPVGPMAVLCLRASLAHGFRAGVTAGLGVAAGDALYAALAAFGFAAAARLLQGGEMWLGLGGGTFLVWLGLATMRRPPAAPGNARPRRGAAASFLATFLLTLANPPTIMLFAAMFAGLGLAGRSAGAPGAAALVAGVFLGSLAWWLLLALAVVGARERLHGQALLWINRLSGAALAAFGLWAMGRAAGLG
jgi:putative LysE/RhtB family amino acid efflux pump